MCRATNQVLIFDKLGVKRGWRNSVTWMLCLPCNQIPYLKNLFLSTSILPSLLWYPHFFILYKIESAHKNRRIETHLPPPSLFLSSSLSHCLTSPVQVPSALRPLLSEMNEGQLTWCCLKHFLSFLFPSPSSFLPRQLVTQWTTDAHTLLTPSPFCTLPVKCYLVHCGLLAWFCCAAGQSEHGLDGGSWWMVFPEPYKASSSLVHWCVAATQLAAQWVCAVYCCGLTSRQMHMDAQHWKGLLCFFIVSIPLTLTTFLMVFLPSFSLLQ